MSQIKIFQALFIVTASLIRNIILASNTRLEEIYAWKEIDYQFPNDETRATAIETEQFIPGNAIITGIEVYKERLFLCTPRIKHGVPSTLNYIPLRKGNTILCFIQIFILH